ncbi:MAG: TraX family protein [Bdellovibrionales bacterium]
MLGQREATTYDLLKTVLIVLMIVDHLAYFFFPDQLWMRAIGRWCVPGWFFLVGYSHKGGFDPALWLAAVIMVAAEHSGLDKPLPLNILLGMALIRFALPYADRLLRPRWLLAPLFVALVLLNGIVTPYIEYGTLGLMLALWGWLLRSGEKTAALAWSAAVMMYFVALQTWVFSFGIADGRIMLLGVLAMYIALWFFRPVPLSLQHAGVQKALQFMGRQTLLIYVVHFLTFALLARVL